MATKNLKKIIRKIYMNAKAKPEDRTFNPLNYPKNWGNAIKALKAKDYRLQFNAIFKPLYKQIYAEDIKVYVDGGHKITSRLKKLMKDNAKEKAKEIAKAKIALAANSPQQGYKEQESVLPEA